MNQPEGEFKARTDLHLGEQSRSGILSARKVRGEEKEEKKKPRLFILINGRKNTRIYDRSTQLERRQDFFFFFC